ncbi:hypothetical protein [Enterococcus sp. AZ196]|uniref:hypothetical protein n=1 Tax=Enterococcus sp. AZ196 TaxID=2774659 RepID=UPI003D290B7A
MAVATKIKKNTEPLKIDFSTIEKVAIEELGFNYKISISCDDGDINLVAQQKELSNIRSSGAITAENAWGTENWHANNLDDTLNELKKLSK